MKKLIIYAVLALFLVGAMAPVADAAPAPALTQLKITAVGANAAGNWIPTAGLSSFDVYGIPAYGGDVVRLNVEYIGYPSDMTTFIYQNGGLLGQARNYQYLEQSLTNGGIVYGFVKCYVIPRTKGYQGSFTVKANGLNGGYAEHTVYQVTLK